MSINECEQINNLREIESESADSTKKYISVEENNDSETSYKSVASNDSTKKLYNKTYSKNYYKDKKDEKIKCDRCNKDVTKFTLKSHYKSAFCQNVFCAKDTTNYLKAQEDKNKLIEAKKIKDEIKSLRKKLDLLYSI